MSGGINWELMLIVFVLPLTLGTATLVLAKWFHKKWARVTMRIFGSALIITFLAAVVEMGPYFWAQHLESKWMPANPTNRMQLESYLSLYSQREIQPSRSMAGHEHQLQAGERMIQYRLLYRAPLEVVYTANDSIVAIYTSYE